jgi:SOS-response transcriptional repressor LexA
MHALQEEALSKVCKMHAPQEGRLAGARGSDEGRSCVGGEGAKGEGSELSVVSAGWPEEVDERCVRLDAEAVLQATPRSFALKVRGDSMIGAGIHNGDVVVGEFTPEARSGAIVVALIDGESTLKRLVTYQGRPHLASENPACPDLVPLSELVIQGIVRCVVKKVR